jgi:hypothetical protein
MKICCDSKNDFEFVAEGEKERDKKLQKARKSCKKSEKVLGTWHACISRIPESFVVLLQEVMTPKYINTHKYTQLSLSKNAKIQNTKY